MEKRKGPSVTQIVATVRKVVLGTQGYVVTTAQVAYGSITFSLNEDVWNEPNPPEPGSKVILQDIRPDPKGWRAYNVRRL